MIKIATNHAITADQFIHVVNASGITRPTEDRGRMQRMLNNANVLLTAWDDEQLIGVLRGVSDRSYCTFVSELAVTKDYQHQGIATKLLLQLRTMQGPNVSIMLLSAPSAMTFYPKVGFEPVPTGFKVQRRY
ncbi:MAG: GNAT family N-acetyltransferase, partial [Lacticaseibacillus paracasei]